MAKSTRFGFITVTAMAVMMVMMSFSVKEAEGLAAPAILYSVELENTLAHPITVEVTYSRFVGEGLTDTQVIAPGEKHFFETHSFTQEITEFYYYISSVKISCPQINEELVANAPFAHITSPTKDLKAVVKMDTDKLYVNL